MEGERLKAGDQVQKQVQAEMADQDLTGKNLLKAKARLRHPGPPLNLLRHQRAVRPAQEEEQPPLMDVVKQLKLHRGEIVKKALVDLLQVTAVNHQVQKVAEDS